MVLLRLQGCNLRCSWCDTKETWVTQDEFCVGLERISEQKRFWAFASASEINSFIRKNFTGPRWVLITGGEPALQELRSLVVALHDDGYKVALETNGTVNIDAPFDWICLSPKPDSDIMLDVIEIADEIKMVVKDKSDIERLDDLLDGIEYDGEICLQPQSLDKGATELCIKTVAKRGWRLSVQVHKLLNLP